MKKNPKLQFRIVLIVASVALGSLGSQAQAQSNYEPYSFATFAGFPPGSVDGTGSGAQFNLINNAGVAVDSAGNVYVADTSNDTIRKITSAGVVSTLAGLAGNPGSADGTGSAARFTQPEGVAVDSAGNVYVGDSGNSTIRKITPAGIVSTLAGLAGSFGSADGTGSAAQFNIPGGVAVDSTGNVYVADTFNNTIREITPAGVVTTLAGLAGTFGSADGTGSAARFNQPYGVTVDGAGNVYVADYLNNTIREITAAGVVTTLAGLAGTVGSADGTGSSALFNGPLGVTVDTAGNIYVADANNNTIRVVTTPAGVVTTLAGLAGSFGSADGTGSAARFDGPAATAVDSSGNVYVADSVNNTIRIVTTPAGVVTTLAGTAGSAGSADGTGSAARFSIPRGAALDSAGNVYVADAFNNTIRVGNPTPPAVTTPVGNSVMVNAGTVGVASVSLTFPQVTMAGTTSVTLINPASAGSLPGGYALTGAGFGYEIETTATYVTPPPIILAFQVPNVDADAFSQLRILHNEGGTLVDATCPDPRPGPTPDPTTQTIYASVTSLSPFVIAKTISAAHVQQPINSNGSSVFSAGRGVVPVKFALTFNGVATCQLPLATIAVTRTAGGTIGPIDESVYGGSADTGSNFRISSCQYVYNLSASALGVGTYRVDIKINSTVVGSATFGLH